MDDDIYDWVWGETAPLSDKFFKNILLIIGILYSPFIIFFVGLLGFMMYYFISKIFLG